VADTGLGLKKDLNQQACRRKIVEMADGDEHHTLIEGTPDELLSPEGRRNARCWLPSQVARFHRHAFVLRAGDVVDNPDCRPVGGARQLVHNGHPVIQ
jgi:hypothetical protein